MWTPKKRNLYLFVILIGLGFALRLLWVGYRSQNFQFQPGGDEFNYYVSTAKNLFVGRGFLPAYEEFGEGNFIPPPLQVIFIFLHFLFAQSLVHPFWPLFSQCLLAAGFLFCTGKILQRLGGDLAAMVGVGILAIHPEMIYWAGFLVTENNYLFLLSLFLFFLVMGLEREKIFWWFLAGISLGFLNLQRGNALLLGLFLCPLLWSFESGKKRIWAISSILILPVFILLPWFVRNLHNSGDPVWVSSHTGTLLHINNRIDYDPLQYPYYDQIMVLEKPGPHIDEIEKAYRNENGKLNQTYYQYAKAYQNVAIRYMLHHPIHFIKNFGIKWVHQFTRVQPYSWNQMFQNRFTWLYFALSWIVLALAIVGGFLWFRRENRLPAYGFWVAFLYFTLIGALFHITMDGRMNLALKYFSVQILAIGIFGKKKPDSMESQAL